MKAKVIIENGETTIILNPENDFDTDIVEKIYENKERFNIHTIVDSDYNYGARQNHRLEISIKEIK